MLLLEGQGYSSQALRRQGMSVGPLMVAGVFTAIWYYVGAQQRWQLIEEAPDGHPDPQEGSFKPGLLSGPQIPDS